MRSDSLKSLFAACSNEDFVAKGHEVGLKEVSVLGLVIHEQDKRFLSHGNNRRISNENADLPVAE